MKKKLVSIVVSHALVIMLLLGCAGKESKYEKAKREAEGKLAELEEILKPVKALEKGDLSVFSANPKTLKRLSKKASIQKIRELSEDVNRAMQKVFELKPQGYEDDYEKWTEKIKERLGSLQ